MKVGYIAPHSISAVNGGVRTQALQTIDRIKAYGIETILLSPWERIEDHQPDLIHIFGASIENIGISDRLYAEGIPSVLSPVFYANHGAGFIKSSIKLEKLAAKIGSGIRSDYSIKAQMCRQSQLILPNTTQEAELLSKAFSISPSKIQVVPNGVEETFSKANPDLFTNTYNLSDFILFVGQAGAPRKNVLKLLEAVREIEAPVVIIGSLYDDDYSRQCKDIIQKNEHILHLSTLPHNSEMLASAYAAAKVFILPSHYETPGIAALEAGLAGANIVITKYGGTNDYFGSLAEYIEPNSRGSIVKGLERALKKHTSDELKYHILSNYTWKKVAEQTAYHYGKLFS